MNTSTTTDTEVYTVSRLNQTVRDLLEECFPTIWVEGEISNFSRPSSGHCYFSLKDSNAQVRCALFKNRTLSLNFSPKDGMQVLMRAKVSLYNQRGEFQLIAEHLEEAGDGALRREFDQLKNKLALEGLFAIEHKKKIPVFPNCIGVVTSPTGAAIKDILSVLNRRAPHVSVIIYPTLVQGELAANQIAKAIETANQRDECDVLIVARGGGSLEDLWPFNAEIVARALFNSHIPTVSGVGHEVDVTIADFVADIRAATPTAAAELVSPDSQKVQHRLNQEQNRLVYIMQQRMGQLKQTLLHLQKRLRHPGQRLQDQSQHLDRSEQRLRRAFEILLQTKHWKLQTLIRALDGVSPLATLKRGYAIATNEMTGAVIKSITATKKDDKIKVKLADGQLDCVVTSCITK